MDLFTGFSSFSKLFIAPSGPEREWRRGKEYQTSWCRGLRTSSTGNWDPATASAIPQYARKPVSRTGYCWSFQSRRTQRKRLRVSCPPVSHAAHLRLGGEGPSTTSSDQTSDSYGKDLWEVVHLLVLQTLCAPFRKGDPEGHECHRADLAKNRVWRWPWGRQYPRMMRAWYECVNWEFY